jgi:hypothetical protein
VSRPEWIARSKGAAIRAEVETKLRRVETGPFGLRGTSGTLWAPAGFAIFRISLIPPQLAMSGMSKASITDAGKRTCRSWKQPVNGAAILHLVFLWCSLGNTEAILTIRVRSFKRLHHGVAACMRRPCDGFHKFPCCTNGDGAIWFDRRTTVHKSHLNSVSPD